jgi:hypothetical protein
MRRRTKRRRLPEVPSFDGRSVVGTKRTRRVAWKVESF